MNQTQLDRNFKLLFYQTGYSEGKFANELCTNFADVKNVLAGYLPVGSDLIDKARICFGVDIASDTPRISSRIRRKYGILLSKKSLIEENFIKYIRTFNVPQKEAAIFFGICIQSITDMLKEHGNLPIMVYRYMKHEWSVDLADDKLDFNKLSMPDELAEHLKEYKRSRMYSRIYESTGVRQNFVNLYKSTCMSVLDFAKSLGYRAGATVSRILNSSMQPTKSMVCAIQQKYGVDITSPDFTLDVHENTKEEVIENLKYLMNTVGISMTAFSKEMDVNLTGVSHLLKGRRSLPSKLATKIRLKYKVDLLHDTRDQIKEKLATVLGSADEERTYLIMNGATFETIQSNNISQYLTFRYGERRNDVKVYRQITV